MKGCYENVQFLSVTLVVSSNSNKSRESQAYLLSAGYNISIFRSFANLHFCLFSR